MPPFRVYDQTMDILAANEWHWWIAVVLTPASILTVLAVIGGYLFKVVKPKYPPRYKKQTPDI